MPAAAVIPAPIAYVVVAAFKTLVVGSRRRLVGRRIAGGGLVSVTMHRRVLGGNATPAELRPLDLARRGAPAAHESMCLCPSSGCVGRVRGALVPARLSLGTEFSLIQLVCSTRVSLAQFC